MFNKLLDKYKTVEVTGNGCMSQSILLPIGKNCTTVVQARETLRLLPPMELFSFPSTAYRRDYLFPIVYSCLLCLRLGDQGVSGWYTDIWNYDIFINPFIERNHRNPKWEKFYHSEGVHTFRIYDRPVATESSLLHRPHHLYHQSFREHHPDFSGLILGSTHPCISSLEVCHSWISGMLLSTPPKSWWPASLMTRASLLLAA